ncbi:hypothetical protein BDR26DRAFT_874741 [Obelidium mucronatum]|nr:hypothetical protein BDR26DRAFT_874741 [Obelidium mucronatum]
MSFGSSLDLEGGSKMADFEDGGAVEHFLTVDKTVVTQRHHQGVNNHTHADGMHSGGRAGFETAESTLFVPTLPSSPNKNPQPTEGNTAEYLSSRAIIDDGRDPIARINDALVSIHQAMESMGLSELFKSYGGIESVLSLLVQSAPPPAPVHEPPQIKRPANIPPPFQMPKTPPSPPPPPPMAKRPASIPQTPKKPQQPMKRPTSQLPPLQHKPPTKPIKIKIDRTPYKDHHHFTPIRPKPRALLHPIPFSFDSRVLDFPKHAPGNYISKGRPQTVRGITWAALDPQLIRVPKHVNMDSGIDLIARAVVEKDLRRFAGYQERMEVATDLLMKIHPEMREFVPEEPSLFGMYGEEGDFAPRALSASWGTLFQN